MITCKIESPKCRPEFMNGPLSAYVPLDNGNYVLVTPEITENVFGPYYENQLEMFAQFLELSGMEKSYYEKEK